MISMFIEKVFCKMVLSGGCLVLEDLYGIQDLHIEVHVYLVGLDDLEGHFQPK